MKIIGLMLLILIAMIFPLWANDYHIFQLTMVYVYAITLLGMNLLLGYNGQFSLGHSAFYAIGAYTAAILIVQYQVPFLLTIPIAGFVAFIFGIIIGIPALRLEGIYLAIATYGLALITPPMLKYFEHWTGGTEGIILSLSTPSFLIPEQFFYYVTLFCLVISFWLGWNMIHSRPGRAIVSIRENPLMASIMGVNVSLYKIIIFGISAAYAGIGGALGTLVIQFVAPDIFTIIFAISFLVGILIGGRASFSGCIYGALFILFVPNISEEISKSAPQVIYGIVLILCIYFMPNGVAGFIKRLLSFFSKRLMHFS